MVKKKKKTYKYLFSNYSILEKIFTEVKYHPLIENFPEYESLRREPAPYNESDKFLIPSFMVPGRVLTVCQY